MGVSGCASALLQLPQRDGLPSVEYARRFVLPQEPHRTSKPRLSRWPGLMKLLYVADMALPPLETARLVLRPCVLGDVDPLHALWTHPDVRRYLWDDVIITRERAAQTVRDAIASADAGLGLWIVIERATGMRAGFCGLIRREPDAAPELMYGLAPASWHRGYATEASEAVLAYAFGVLRAARVTAATDVPNGASIRVMERLGFRYVRRGLLNGLDTLFYEITSTSRRSGRPAE
jgi:ribosomal-protein-alanine N-acetyltransferase